MIEVEFVFSKTNLKTGGGPNLNTDRPSDQMSFVYLP
jgi:hypothetical protein